MLSGEPYAEPRNILGQSVVIEALPGALVDEFDRRLGQYKADRDAGKNPNARWPFAWAMRHTVKRGDGAPVYLTDEEAAGEDLRTWNALRDAWLEVNGMGESAGKN